MRIVKYKTIRNENVYSIYSQISILMSKGKLNRLLIYNLIE